MSNDKNEGAASGKGSILKFSVSKLLVGGLFLISLQIAVPLLLAKNPQRLGAQPIQDVQPARETEPVQHPRSRGPVSAPVQVVEFSNFACPSCRAIQGDLKELLDLYGDRIFYTFRHFPKFEDSKSVYAHIAAECASEQAAFWPYYDKLFAEQPVWHSRSAQKGVFADYARELGLDLDRFEACFQDEAVFERVSNEIDQGEAMGVTHTPTFLINDRFFVGPTQFREKGIPLIKKLLEDEG